MSDDGWVDVPAASKPASDEWVDVPAAGSSDGWSDAAKPLVNQTSVGSVMRAFGEGFGEAWGPEKLGLSDQSVQWLAKKGIFASGSKFENPFHAFNEGVIMPAATALDAVTRLPGALYRGAQAAGVEAGLPGDIVSLPDAFAGSPGALGKIEMRPGLPKGRSVQVVDAVLPEPQQIEMKNPVVGFHGSRDIIGQFDPAQTRLDRGVFFAERPELASKFAEGRATDSDPMRIYGEDSATEIKRWVREHAGDAEADRIGNLIDQADKIDPESDHAGELSRSINDELSKLSGLDQEYGPSNPNVTRVRIDLGKSYEFDFGGKFDWTKEREAIDYAKEHGYDSVTFKNGGVEGDFYSIFRPEQIEQFAWGKTINQAKDLGLVGPEKPPLADAPTPKAAAEQVVPRTMAAEGPKGEKVTQELPGQQDEWQQRFDHFVGRLQAPDDVKDLIRNAAKENGDFMPARQGKIPLGQVEDIATAAGVDPAEVNARGLGRRLQNDGEVRSAMQLMLKVTDDVKAAARDVRAGGDETSLAKLQEAIMRRDLAVEQVVGLRAEWGRTGNVFQEFMTKSREENGLTDFLKSRGRTPDDLRAIADTVDALDGPQTARFLNDMRTPSAWDKFRYYWVNALISGPVTHAKYAIANTAFGLYESGVVTPIAGTIGAIRRAATGGNEGVYLGEAAARTWGIVAGVPDALKAAVSAAKTGLQTPLPGEIAQNIIPKQNKNLAFQQRPIGGPAGAIIGAPSRGASAIHSFFNFLGYRASIEAQAYRQAAKEGLSPSPPQPVGLPSVAPGFIRFFHGGDNPGGGGGRWVNQSQTYATNYRPGQSVHYVDIPHNWLDQRFPDTDLYRPIDGTRGQSYPSFEAPEQFAKQMKPVDQSSVSTSPDSFWQRRQHFADNPTADMMNAAIEEGYRLTFINELGENAKAVQNLVNKTVVGQLIMPFVHIPMNILKRAMEGTPLTLFDSETRDALAGKQGTVKQDMAAARLIAGGAAGAWAVNQVLNGRMTGFGPTDPKERAQWLATGHQPYSIRIGDEWLSFNRFGPIGTMLGLYSNLAEVIPHVKPDNEELTKGIALAVHSTGRLMEDEVGMQGLAGLIEAIEDPERRGTRFVSSLAGSMLPYSSMLRQVASAMDPSMREAKTVVDGLRYYIPQVRQGLLPKRDWSGTPIANAGYGGDLPVPGASAIIQHRNAVSDPVALELADLDIKPAPPQDRIKGVKLPPKLYDQYQSTAGPFTRTALEAMINQPGWHDIPQFARAEIVRSLIKSTRETAATAMQMGHPEIIAQGVKDRMDKINGVKPTKLKDAD